MRPWLLVPLLALCACGRIDDDSLRIATWGSAADDSDFAAMVDTIYANFEQRHGVEVSVEMIPGTGEYVSKMLLSFVGGTEPDIMTLDASSAAVFIDNGVLLDLAPYIEGDPEFDLDAYWDNAVQIGRRGDAIYHIPTDFTPMVMYYNKRIFDEAGVPYPEPGWSYADFMAAAKATTSEDVYGFEFVNWMAGWITWLWNNGGDVLSADGTRATGVLNSPQNVEAIRFLRDLIDKHEVAPSLSRMASLGVDLFASGRAAMKVSGHWSLIGFQNAPKNSKGEPLLHMEDVGVVELPTNLPSGGVTVMYESGLAIGRNCDEPELAWEFIKYWTSYPVQMKYNSSGIAICGRKDVARERAVGELEETFLEIVPSARPPWGATVEGYEQVEAIGVRMLDSVLEQGVSVDVALARAAREIDEFFANKR